MQIVLAFYSVRANVGASFSGHSSPTSSAVSAAEASLNAALSLSIICLAVCFTGLFAGYTLMFDRSVLKLQHLVGCACVQRPWSTQDCSSRLPCCDCRLNFLHCVLQFFGGVLMAWYLLDLWSYTSAWCVFRPVKQLSRLVL